MGACGDNTGTDVGNTETDADTDSDSDSDTTMVTVASQINFAYWDGETVVDDIQDAPGAGFTVDDGITGVTTTEIQIPKGTHTVDFEIVKTSRYLGSVTGSTDEGAFIGDLCVDLSGDWTCEDVEYGDTWETVDATMNGCSIDLNGIGANIKLDGHKTSFIEGGVSMNGVASLDGTLIDGIVTLNSGTSFPLVCTK